MFLFSLVYLTEAGINHEILELLWTLYEMGHMAETEKCTGMFAIN